MIGISLGTWGALGLVEISEDAVVQYLHGEDMNKREGKRDLGNGYRREI